MSIPWKWLEVILRMTLDRLWLSVIHITVLWLMTHNQVATDLGKVMFIQNLGTLTFVINYPINSIKIQVISKQHEHHWLQCQSTWGLANCNNCRRCWGLFISAGDSSSRCDAALQFNPALCWRASPLHDLLSVTVRKPVSVFLGASVEATGHTYGLYASQWLMAN